MMQLDSELKQFPVWIEIPVQWGDMDAAQHVNNLIYLRWGESSRIAYFEQAGFGFSFNQGIGPILAWQDCKYIFPITYPDTAIIAIKVTEIKEDRFFMQTNIYSKVHQRIAAISKQSIIPYDYSTLKKAAIPEKWLVAIKTL
ncbi:MAG: thioesterase family protein [Saprospiraceae bacterium]